MNSVEATDDKNPKNKELTLDEILQSVGAGFWTYIIFVASFISEYRDKSKICGRSETV